MKWTGTHGQVSPFHDTQLLLGGTVPAEMSGGGGGELVGTHSGRLQAPAGIGDASFVEWWQSGCLAEPLTMHCTVTLGCQSPTMLCSWALVLWLLQCAYAICAHHFCHCR